MSLLTNPVPDRAIYPDGPVFRLTVANYHEMIASGILTSDDRVELLEGALICKMSKNPRHRTSVIKLQRALPKLLPESTFPQFQDPITLVDSEPEPDGSVVLGALETFSDRHPSATEVGLVIEVADSSLRQDRGIKRKLYASAGIPTYWIVNLIESVVELYEQPAMTSGTYGKTTIFGPGQRVPVVVGGILLGEIAVDELLP